RSGGGISAAGRARIASAARARSAKIRASKPGSQTNPAPKRTMSAAARRNCSISTSEMGASEAKEIIAETHRDSLVSLNTYEQADELLDVLAKAPVGSSRVLFKDNLARQWMESCII